MLDPEIPLNYWALALENRRVHSQQYLSWGLLEYELNRYDPRFLVDLSLTGPALLLATSSIAYKIQVVRSHRNQYGITLSPPCTPPEQARDSYTAHGNMAGLESQTPNSYSIYNLPRHDDLAAITHSAILDLDISFSPDPWVQCVVQYSHNSRYADCMQCCKV